MLLVPLLRLLLLLLLLLLVQVVLLFLCFIILQSDLAEKSGQVDNLQSDLAEKDAELEALRVEVQEEAGKCQKLEMQVIERWSFLHPSSRATRRRNRIPQPSLPPRQTPLSPEAGFRQPSLATLHLLHYRSETDVRSRRNTACCTGGGKITSKRGC